MDTYASPAPHPNKSYTTRTSYIPSSPTTLLSVSQSEHTLSPVNPRSIQDEDPRAADDAHDDDKVPTSNRGKKTPMHPEARGPGAARTKPITHTHSAAMISAQVREGGGTTAATKQEFSGGLVPAWGYLGEEGDPHLNE